MIYRRRLRSVLTGNNSVLILCLPCVCCAFAVRLMHIKNEILQGNVYQFPQFKMSSFESQDFLRARRRYHTPIEIDDEVSEVPETPQQQVLETPQHQLILRDLSLSPPPVNRRAPPATYKEKIQIQTLRNAGFTLDWISRITGKPPTTVSYITHQPATPRKQKIGKYFNTPRRQQLAAWIERDPAHRRLSYAQIIHIHGFTCSETTVRRALAAEKIFRFRAKRAPWMRSRNKTERRNYVAYCLTLPLFTWLYTIWTDEGFFSLAGAPNAWVTRRRNEGFHPDNMISKFKSVNFGVMVWIAFTARTKCRLIFWEKSWGKISSASFIQHVVPVLAEFAAQEEQITAQPHQVVQDRAPSHVAHATLTEMHNRGLRLLDHPASSPDLNLAENPIGRIKYNLLNRRERRPTSERELREAIEWEWASFPQEKLAALCEGFPRRLRAVQRVNGGPTKY